MNVSLIWSWGRKCRIEMNIVGRSNKNSWFDEQKYFENLENCSCVERDFTEARFLQLILSWSQHFPVCNFWVEIWFIHFENIDNI